MKLIKLLILFTGLLFGPGVKAQTKQVTHQSLFWMRYYNQLMLDEKWTWHNEIDERRFFEKNRHHHLIMHSRMNYKISKTTDVAFGFTYSRQSPHDPNSASELAVPELRPNQEINFSVQMNKRLTIQHRIRTEERFFRKNDDTKLIKGYDFNFRFRYKLQANYQFTKEGAKKPATLKMANEIMVNAGKNIVFNRFDQNRIYAAIEQEFSKKFSVELGYMYWYQQRASGYQFFDRDIIRLTVYHKLSLKKTD